MHSRIIVRLRIVISLFLAAAALVLALSASPAATAAPVRFNTSSSGVAIVDFAFSPAVVTITTGSSVEWTNTGAFTHTTTSNTSLWTQTLGPGDIFSTTFDAPGHYAYHCAIHPFMQGEVVVLTSVYLPLIMRS